MQIKYMGRISGTIRISAMVRTVCLSLCTWRLAVPVACKSGDSAALFGRVTLKLIL